MEEQVACLQTRLNEKDVACLEAARNIGMLAVNLCSINAHLSKPKSRRKEYRPSLFHVILICSVHLAYDRWLIREQWKDEYLVYLIKWRDLNILRRSARLGRTLGSTPAWSF